MTCRECNDTHVVIGASVAIAADDVLGTARVYSMGLESQDAYLLICGAQSWKW